MSEIHFLDTHFVSSIGCKAVLRLALMWLRTLSNNKEATQTFTEVKRAIFVSDCFLGTRGVVLFKDTSAAWDLLNISPLAVSSPPPHQHFDSGWQEVIETCWKAECLQKSDTLGREVLLFDLVCSCWFWDWEMVTGGVVPPGRLDVLQTQQENTTQFKGENYRVLSWKTGVFSCISVAFLVNLVKWAKLNI